MGECHVRSAGAKRLSEVAWSEMQVELATERLELRPLPPAVAGELLRAREQAVRELGVEIPLEWPDHDLVELLVRHAGMTSSEAVWSIWPIIDREARAVVGDF